MKQKLFSIIASLVIIGIIAVAGYSETHYKKDAVVCYTIGKEVEIETKDGNRWRYYGTGFKQGDKVKVTFFNNNTDLNIYDDEVTRIR